MVAVIEVDTQDEINELIDLLYGNNDIILEKQYSNFIDLTTENVNIL